MIENFTTERRRKNRTIKKKSTNKVTDFPKQYRGARIYG